MKLQEERIEKQIQELRMHAQVQRHGHTHLRQLGSLSPLTGSLDRSVRGGDLSSGGIGVGDASRVWLGPPYDVHRRKRRKTISGGEEVRLSRGRGKEGDGHRSNASLDEFEGVSFRSGGEESFRASEGYSRDRDHDRHQDYSEDGDQDRSRNQDYSRNQSRDVSGLVERFGGGLFDFSGFGDVSERAGDGGEEDEGAVEEGERGGEGQDEQDRTYTIGDVPRVLDEQRGSTEFVVSGASRASGTSGTSGGLRASGASPSAMSTSSADMELATPLMVPTLICDNTGTVDVGQQYQQHGGDGQEPEHEREREQEGSYGEVDEQPSYLSTDPNPRPNDDNMPPLYADVDADVEEGNSHSTSLDTLDAVLTGSGRGVLWTGSTVDGFDVPFTGAPLIVVQEATDSFTELRARFNEYREEEQNGNGGRGGVRRWVDVGPGGEESWDRDRSGDDDDGNDDGQDEGEEQDEQRAGDDNEQEEEQEEEEKEAEEEEEDHQENEVSYELVEEREEQYDDEGPYDWNVQEEGNRVPSPAVFGGGQDGYGSDSGSGSGGGYLSGHAPRSPNPAPRLPSLTPSPFVLSPIVGPVGGEGESERQKGSGD
ncbi:hypothetical protein FA15DRAFT_123169 [Coprinopsis marcescibilis]|uniref:Uncharacterized protein n=1 Tax=Coprinopsis marcescibilis TaxID=230819 RepID=A0A5C3KKW6_COPMA|nr:hypothetical protein FA15DRAFT_123169 [Coprinopsis marcescibilis]